MKRIYLDYAATTPVDRRVSSAMEPFFSNEYGNPSSLHMHGQRARATVDNSRETVASLLNGDFRNIIFTGSATEANNMFLRGAVERSGEIFKKTPRIIISAIEHESIYTTARNLEKRGDAEVIVIPVDENGLVSPQAIGDALTKETVLVSITYVNNEIGTVEPIEKIGEVIKKFRASQNNSFYPLFHTDAVQAFQYYSCDVKMLGVDAITLSPHKLYGPKGIGVLFVRDHKMISPCITGGGQEFGFRSGTEAVHAIVGCARALEIATTAREYEHNRTRTLLSEAWNNLAQGIPESRLNGLLITEGNRAPHIMNIFVPGWEKGDIVVALDQAGISVSAGPACSARSQEPSRILQEIGRSKEDALSSVRISIGRQTASHELEKAVRTIVQQTKERNKVLGRS